ncbi:MAG TPA: type I methionyl aminopeptidase [Candidatus Eisenbacteria bacterium]|nr:type I methionyl aminopeptidase [Candidatus Eisenbacteria bacterium]
MKIHIKTPQELEAMKKGGKILSSTMWEVLKHVKPGVTELEIDALAEKHILSMGGKPGFKAVRGYHHTICASTNDVVVHGIPTSYALRSGDVFGIDCGVLFDGFHTDMAETVIVGGEEKASKEVVQFLKTGKKALEEALAQVKPGNRIGHISQVIQQIVEKDGGYGVTRELIGHGVGKKLHEDPPVPGYLSRRLEKTPLLVEGMVIAVEVIYNMGKKEIAFAGTDDWTIKSRDGSLSGLFERTVAVTATGHRILTP